MKPLSVEDGTEIIEEMLEELRCAQMTTYQYEQTLLALGRNEAAAIYTDRYRRIKRLIAKVEAKHEH